MLAEDIFCPPDGPRMLDCIEFDDRMRYLDGLDDIAFLAMDLEYLGQPDPGARLQHWYAEFAADPAPASLRHQFVAYRAFERSNVNCMRHARGDEAAVTDVARAQMLLERGETAVLDATWSRSGWREMAAKTATRTHGAFVALRCVADFDVVAARSRSRTGSASDASEDAFRQGRNAEGPRSSGAPLG